MRGLKIGVSNGLISTNAVGVGEQPQVWLPQVRDAAIKYVAAECCAFVRALDARSEQVAPYKGWIRQLGSLDTVITFNYDTLLERLSRDSAHDSDRMSFVLSANDWEPTSRARVLKLHGSVDWQWKTRLDRATLAPRDFAECCQNTDDVCMATPGPSKKESVERRFPFLWKCAEEALTASEVVFFIGYRFPPTDAEARKRLLDAIQKNTSQHLQINVVLGPKRGEDIDRLEALVHYACQSGGRWNFKSTLGATPSKSYIIRTLPLLAEDFLSVARRDTWYQQLSKLDMQ